VIKCFQIQQNIQLYCRITGNFREKSAVEKNDDFVALIFNHFVTKIKSLILNMQQKHAYTENSDKVKLSVNFRLDVFTIPGQRSQRNKLDGKIKYTIKNGRNKGFEQNTLNFEKCT